jgi:hypothetical protein
MIDEIFPLPLREGARGRGANQHRPERVGTPPPDPLSQGEGEEVGGASGLHALKPGAGRVVPYRLNLDPRDSSTAERPAA